MHDPRIGRFFAVDPLASKYPYNSPYAFSQNMVIGAVELEGLEAVPTKEIWKLSESTTASIHMGHIDMESGNKYAKIHGENVILVNIKSGPNKGNFAGYTLGEGTTVQDFFKVFHDGEKVPGFDADLSYVVGKDRVPERAHTGDLGSVSTGSPLMAASSDYDYSSTLGGLDGVNAMNDNLIGYFSNETGEWVETGTTFDYFYEKVFTPWKEVVTDPTNYGPSPIRIKSKGTFSGMTDFKKSTKGVYTGTNKTNLKEGFQRSISKDAAIDVRTDPANTEKGKEEKK